jgi:hypothetical protein
VIDFVGIGAQKAATTWIFECLRCHPEVYFPGGKEIHFWDQGREWGTDWWLGIYRNSAHKGRKQGEITPAYALLDEDAIRQIAAVAPELRLFYSIRNPIARAWSHALMALGRAGSEVDDLSDLWFIEHFTSAASRGRGDYLFCLDRWSAVFGAGKLHVILFDDIVADPKRVLGGLACHIEIDPEFFLRLPDELVSQPVFAGPAPPTRPVLLDFLRTLYLPAIISLSEEMQRDFMQWLSWDGVCLRGAAQLARLSLL